METPPRGQAVVGGLGRLLGNIGGVRNLLLFVLLLPVLAPMARMAASDSEFAGVAEMAQTISGLRDERQDQDELGRYAKQIEARVAQVRSDLATAPPVVAQTLKEDLAFYMAEQDRIAVMSGRELTLGTSTYKISRGRVALTRNGIEYRIDRNRGTAQARLPDNRIEIMELAPLPDVDASGGEPGPVLLGMATTRYVRTIGGKRYTICLAGGLPNVCALTLIRGATDNDLFAGIARLPGIPLLVETQDGDIVRRLQATRLTARELPDSDFVPWK